MYKIAITLILAGLLAGCVSAGAPKSNPQLAEIDIELMALNLESHQTDLAREHLLGAIQAAPHDPEVMIGQGYFDEKLGDLQAARVAYEAGIGVDPNDPRLENQYGSFLYQEGEYQQALAYFKRASENPDNASALEANENAALTAEKLGEPTLAQFYFSKVAAEN